MTEFFDTAWGYKFSLLPVLITFLVFEIPSVVRRMSRWAYTPIYFMFFPLGHSDRLYAQYFNEDDFYGIGAAQSPEEKTLVRKRIISTSIISMIISTIITPLFCGYISAFYLSESQFLEFIWFLMMVKTAQVFASIYNLRFVYFVHVSKTFYWMCLTYAGYLFLIWYAVNLSHEWTSANINAMGSVETVFALLRYIYKDLFLSIAIVAAATWAITFITTDPKYISDVETYHELLDGEDDSDL